jgi:hypothetical protein
MRSLAPDRARLENKRPGSFKKGHAKRGGRKKGTSNVISAEYRKAILEAAYRIGYDGNGKGGVIGYFTWFAERHEFIFWTELFVSLLQYEIAVGPPPEEPHRTAEERDQWLRDYIGCEDKFWTKKPKSPVGWTGRDFPVGALMQLAVKKPTIFCKVYTAAFLRPPPKRHRAAA